eukprot:CAMPEP_0172495964 /NCGR_PEP_ID=MMETSP1066-20121228/79761_1 /TAXON_ID=671091 /ORGANISM="Coscinodiscus wailesii, Strain CCMP2513" /LENGTH=322 /DNA_ID=CAMNT_0013267995 /DNA_START=126 /DNA_END=1094 /DNA_ORIENTATION=+
MTPKSIIIPFPPRFKDYLLSDGVRLPSCCDDTNNNDDDDSFSSCTSFDNNRNNNNYQPEDDDDDDTSTAIDYSFPQFTEAINEGISSLGGSVFPKCNWSSPRDAAWINMGTLKCTSAKEVYLLFKSSDFVVHDLEHALESQDEQHRQGDNDNSFEFCLVLRKWCHLHRSMEFRCFVKNHQLIAISQRDHTQYYPHLSSSLPRIRDLIHFEFHENIKSRFVLSCYVVDLYIDTRGKVWVLDFNVWGEQTDSLLFSWDELNSGGEVMEGVDDGLVVRLVQGEKEVRGDPLASYRAPIDVVSLASHGGGLEGEGFEEFVRMCQRP